MADGAVDITFFFRPNHKGLAEFVFVFHKNTSCHTLLLERILCFDFAQQIIHADTIIIRQLVQGAIRPPGLKGAGICEVRANDWGVFAAESRISPSGRRIPPTKIFDFGHLPLGKGGFAHNFVGTGVKRRSFYRFFSRFAIGPSGRPVPTYDFLT